MLECLEETLKGKKILEIRIQLLNVPPNLRVNIQHLKRGSTDTLVYILSGFSSLLHVYREKGSSY